MADCKKCRFRSICKKRPKTEGATIAECDLFRNDIERTETMTNADRIRAMTDEELADMFARFEFSIAKEVCAEFGVDLTAVEHDFGASAKEELEWLQQPVKENK